MESSLSFQIAVWVWIILGAAGVIGAVVLAIREVGLDYDEWWATAICLGMGTGGSGLLTLALATAGWPSTALYVWRGTATAAMLLGLVIILQDRSSPSRWVAAIGILVIGGLILLSFLRLSLPKSTALVESSALVIESRAGGASSQIAPSLSTMIWGGTLVLLAFGTLVFLVLFAQRLRRGGAPKLETHWEGIGGGLGGWRMSSSLGYLLVAGALGLLFSFFFLKFDAREREQGLTDRASPTPTIAPR